MSVAERLIARWSRSRIGYPIVRAHAVWRGSQADIAERDYYSASALHMADELRRAAYTHNPVSFEAVCLKVAPGWFTTAIRGKRMGEPDGPWDQVARTSARIDWFRLLHEHPDELEVLEEELLANQYVPFSIFQDVWEAAAARGLEPSLHTDLWIGTRGQIQLWPNAVSANSPTITAEDDRSIRSMIHASGYGDSLEPDREPGFWNFY